MQQTKKFIIQFIIIEVSSIFFGIVLGMQGAEYSGRFMVTEFMGNVGWQAGALFYGLIGISLGAYIGALVSTRALRIRGSFFAGFVGSVLVYVSSLIPYDHGIEVLGAFQLYLFPAIVVMVGINWHLVRSKLNIN